MRTIPAHLIDPKTDADRYAATAFKKSMQDAGRGDELKRRPINVGPIRRGKKKGRMATYRDEWESLSPKAQRRQSGFESFVARRDNGLVAPDGSPTNPKRRSSCG